MIGWVNSHYSATVYEDAYSPFCLIAERNEDADAIYEFLQNYCKQVPELSVVRNDVYARFCHVSFNKGSALSEIARQLGVSSADTFAAGDHLNDLPMLARNHAHWLAAPANAIAAVKAVVREQNGHVSSLLCGHGVAEGLEFHLNNLATAND